MKDLFYTKNINDVVTQKELKEHGYNDLKLDMGKTNGYMYSVYSKNTHRLMLIQKENEKTMKVYLKFQDYKPLK